MADNVMKKDKAFEEKKLVDDRQMDAVDGGTWSDSDWFYESGDAPKWELNKRVKLVYQGKVEYGTITAVSETKDGGLINKEFTYTILFDSNMTVEKIYESAIDGYSGTNH